MHEQLVTAIESGDPAVLHLAGDIDRVATDVIEAATTQILEAEPARVVLDFSRAGYINSSGIALIVGLLGKARAAGVSVHARGLSAHYRRIFEITRLSAYMTIEEEGEDNG